MLRGNNIHKLYIISKIIVLLFISYRNSVVRNARRKNAKKKKNRKQGKRSTYGLLRDNIQNSSTKIQEPKAELRSKALSAPVGPPKPAYKARNLV